MLKFKTQIGLALLAVAGLLIEHSNLRWVGFCAFVIFICAITAWKKSQEGKPAAKKDDKSNDSLGTLAVVIALLILIGGMYVMLVGGQEARNWINDKHDEAIHALKRNTY